MPRRKTDLVHVPQTPAALARELQELQEIADRQVELAAAENTRIAYTRDFSQFQAWCDERGAEALPASEKVVSLYLAELERRGRKPSTIDRKLAAIVRVHRAGGHHSPRTARISEQLKGIKRGSPGKRPDPTKEAPPLLPGELTQLVEKMASYSHAELIARDKAILLVGWACAMRRAEIVGLELRDVEHTAQGWQIWIRRSKTDQEGKGIALALAPAERNKALCPVTALERWLEVRGTKPGALFWKSCERGGGKRSAPQLITGEPIHWKQVNHLVARWCKRAEVTAAVPFSPHSLRAGFITEAIRSGRPIKETKDRSRHASMDVFFKYVRTAMTFENNVQKGLL